QEGHIEQSVAARSTTYINAVAQADAATDAQRAECKAASGDIAERRHAVVREIDYGRKNIDLHCSARSNLDIVAESVDGSLQGEHTRSTRDDRDIAAERVDRSSGSVLELARAVSRDEHSGCAGERDGPVQCDVAIRSGARREDESAAIDRADRACRQ